jgi:hypothetical protein
MAKAQELELFRADSANYDRSTPILRIQPKPSFQEAVAPAVLPAPKPLIKDSLGQAIGVYVANVRVHGAQEYRTGL